MMNPDDLAPRLELATTLVREVEAHLVDAIAQHFPSDALIGQEGGAHGTVGADTPVWVVDPIDGTDNFARGLPLLGPLSTPAL